MMREQDCAVEFEVGSALARNASGAITGRVVIKVGDMTFPDGEWLDFIDILVAWVDAIRAGGKAILYFMDGPFEVRISDAGLDGDIAELSLIARTAGGSQAVKTCSISRAQLTSALASACQKLASSLDQAGYHGEAREFERAGVACET